MRDHDLVPRTAATRRRTALLAVGLLALAACSSGGDPAPVASGAAEPAPATSAAAQPVAPSPPAPTTSPFSGREGGIGTPVMVVKYDNTREAQPHRGLPSADVVYVEPVEWGLTRIAAVFSTDMPEVAGPVRSARVSDIDLLAQYGRVAFVFSGAQGALWPRINAADWIPVSEDNGGAGFFRERGTGRYAPTNLMSEPGEVLDAVAGEVGTSADMGWVFDEQPPPGGARATTVTARWPNSSVQLRWNAKKDAWDIWMNGQQARDTDAPKVQRASTVIVQYVKQGDSGFGDKFGGVTPKVRTVGSGKGLLLRDGRSYPIRWERPGEDQPTAWLDSSGAPIALDPGQVWVLLKDRTQKVVVE